MDERSESNGGRSWINDPTYVVLVAADGAEEFDRNAPGLNHLAFHAASREQVDAITAGVRERTDSAVRYEDQHPYAGGTTRCTARILRGSRSKSWRRSESGTRTARQRSSAGRSIRPSISGPSPTSRAYSTMASGTRP